MDSPFIIELLKNPIKNLFGFVKRHVSYPFNYDSNVHKLQHETEELKNKRDRLQQSVDEAKDNGHEIYENVTNWLNKAEVTIKEAEELALGKEAVEQKRCFVGLCPSLKSRYQLSISAEKEALAIDELKKEENLDRVSCPPPPKQMIAPSVYNREGLQSRVSLLKDVTDALQDPNHNMIGVYGMGGVGKTTLAKEVQRKAVAENLFGVVVFVAVSLSPEISRIQKEIAEVLGLTLVEEGLPLRANRLCERLKKEQKSILIILDDVWNQIKLEDIGIPFGDDCKGCKILLTSRRIDVCREMGAKWNFPIGALSEEDAWSLFEKTVMGDDKDQKLPLVAKEVARKCSGLPLLIVIVATDLRKRGHWDDMLKRLSEFDDEEMETKVQSILKKSYDNLPTEEVKQFFLLCGFFGQANIFVEDLLKYSMGLGFLRHVHTVTEARNRVGKLMDDLKAECLLLEGDMDKHVKMHDTVRDTGRSIASKEQKAFIGISKSKVREWPNKDCNRISLVDCDIQWLPEILDCPKAELFLLVTEDFSLRIPESFFEGMKELKVVDLSGVYLQPLPSSLGHLANIHTLCLHGCRLDDISIVGQLKQLEVLSLRRSYIVKLPREIEQLTQLKLLDLSDCLCLEVFPVNILSKLSKLEELYMWGSFNGWDSEGNVSVAELGNLPHLSTFESSIPHFKVFPELRLKKYRLAIGLRWRSTEYKSSKILYLNLKKIPLADEIKVFLREAEELYLEGDSSSKDYKNLSHEFSGFPQFKKFTIVFDGVIENIINSSEYQIVFPTLVSLELRRLKRSKTICNCQLAAGSFKNLRILQVGGCSSLRYLLSYSSAKCLSQLQDLRVEDCKSLEYIVGGGESEDNDDMVEFPQLTFLSLYRLPNLKSFCERQFDDDISLLFCDSKVSLPKLSKVSVYQCWKLENVYKNSWQIKNTPLSQIIKLRL